MPGREITTLVSEQDLPLETVAGVDLNHRRLVVSAPAASAALATEATVVQIRDRLQSQVLAFTMETAELAGVDIFAADGVAPRDGFLLVEFITNTAAVLSLKVIRSAVTRVGDLNDGGTISANRWFTFTLPVRSGDSLNLRVSVGGTVSAMLSFQDKS